jgi:hypothetical protein
MKASTIVVLAVNFFALSTSGLGIDRRENM